jgi:hypothetical protein
MSWLFALLVAGVGCGVSFWVDTGTLGDHRMVVYGSIVSAFLLGKLWWRWLEQRREGSLVVGLCAGLVVVVCAHVLAFWITIVGNWGCYWLLGECRGSTGEEPLNPANGVVGALVYGVGSLLGLGWVTLPLGGGLGILAVFAQRKLVKRLGGAFDEKNGEH